MTLGENSVQAVAVAAEHPAGTVVQRSPGGGTKVSSYLAW